MALKLLAVYPIFAAGILILYVYFQVSSWVITRAEPQDFDRAVAQNKTTFGDFGSAFFVWYAMTGVAFVGVVFLYGAMAKAFNRWLPRRLIPGAADTRNGILYVAFIFAFFSACIQVAMNGKTVTVANTDGQALFNAAAWSFFIGLGYLVCLLALVLVLNVLDYDPEEEYRRLAALGPVVAG